MTKARFIDDRLVLPVRYNSPQYNKFKDNINELINGPTAINSKSTFDLTVGLDTYYDCRVTDLGEPYNDGVQTICIVKLSFRRVFDAIS